MAKHEVKCLYCSQIFDINKEPFIKIGRRYAHKDCEENHNQNLTQDDQDLKELENFILDLFEIPFLSVKIKNQIKSYHNENHYSYSGILKTLKYWFKVKNNSIEQANDGIGIVPYCYDIACQYYYNLYLAQNANTNKDISEYLSKIKNITIPSPNIEKSPKLFFEGEDS